MDAQTWVVIQIGIDVVLAGTVLGYLRSLTRRQLPRGEYKEVVERSEAILAEMKQLGLMLEKNLHEKREISRHLLEQLDQGLAKAQAHYRKIQEWQQHQEETRGSVRDGVPESGSQPAIRSLHAQGLSNEAIARQLNVPLGEVELYLKMEKMKT